MTTGSPATTGLTAYSADSQTAYPQSMGQLNVTPNPTLSLSPNDTDQQATPWTAHNATYMAPSAESADESVNLILIGVSVIAVVVMILLMMLVVLRYHYHQKGSYYTHEEALAFKSDPEVQDVPESLEDPEEEEP
ncbi:hypothetical protein ABG768_002071 [Culter alburnus]|uniref:Uncharacterized protein n=1 Tax=Culter alburnus TaxID=194366 RepID=A0AAW2A2W6_CULAL